ncbi:hypothetical protein Bca52824_000579 [Brassica carinata]|uniref:F-box domain-containing protein n=1 Tax=Brassica carinata TaxID=52824 RepID=A0A8X7WER8_BRACI|nr:hypothetical protein Bca52824_000579 [Brassica carinata]
MTKDGRYRDWAGLPPDLTWSILSRLSTAEILEKAQGVCKSWHRVCKEPSMWRKINMHKNNDLGFMGFLTSASNLRILRIAMCREIRDGLLQAAGKLPFLEELDISYCSFEAETLRAVGKSCPHLKTLKLNYHVVGYTDDDENEIAIAIGESMPKLRHLHLSGNKNLSNTCLKAILDGCLHLEHLDILALRFWNKFGKLLMIAYVYGISMYC